MDRRSRVQEPPVEGGETIAGLRSELSSASATARIERIAKKELGLVQADPDQTVYLRLRP